MFGFTVRSNTWRSITIAFISLLNNHPVIGALCNSVFNRRKALYGEYPIASLKSDLHLCPVSWLRGIVVSAIVLSCFLNDYGSVLAAGRNFWRAVG